MPLNFSHSPNLQNPPNHTLSIAPMLDWTHTHCRYFHRLLAPKALVYTEMITTGALIYGDAKRHLNHHAKEHPISVQLGGSDLADLQKAVQIIEPYAYDQINLNCGCPSERVQKGFFGAALMKEADLVARCVEGMQKMSSVPITVKHRIGIDDEASYAFVQHFVKTVASAGCKTFIVHARNAWLKGLSPKDNREIPPLNYSFVFQLKQDFPDLTIILNGGVAVEDISTHLTKVDGVMLGRLAYHQPNTLQQVSNALWQTPILPFIDLIEHMHAYALMQLEQGVYLGSITQSMLGLPHGLKNARLWRQHLSNHALMRQINTPAQMTAFWQQALAIAADF